MRFQNRSGDGPKVAVRVKTGKGPFVVVFANVRIQVSLLSGGESAFWPMALEWPRLLLVGQMYFHMKTKIVLVCGLKVTARMRTSERLHFLVDIGDVITEVGSEYEALATVGPIAPVFGSVVSLLVMPHSLVRRVRVSTFWPIALILPRQPFRSLLHPTFCTTIIISLLECFVVNLV